jgi:DnaJ-class molecular chaperone with C-terminal Zn finger domain
MNNFTDYYAILGIQPTATSATVKNAFKKLALQYHPDIYKGADANERMAQILQAYRTLNDTEARRLYDAQRLAHAPVVTGSVQTQTTVTYPTAAATDGYKKRAQKGIPDEVSPQARRDRQRHYAFPLLRAGEAVTVDLVDYRYRLTADEAAVLLRDGLLRGLAASEQQRQFYCQRCHHHWSVAQGSSGEPVMSSLVCPHCYAPDWSEFLLLRCMHCHAIFASEQIRYETMRYASGPESRKRQGARCNPYELFPLCPYCARSHWCPAEDARVATLQRQVTARAAVSRLLWIVGIAAVILFCMSFILLR